MRAFGRVALSRHAASACVALLLASAAATPLQLPAQASAKTFIAKSDRGKHSLRGAIRRANAHRGPDRVVITTTIELRRPVTARDDLTIVGSSEDGQFLDGGDPIAPRSRYGVIRFDAPGHAQFVLRRMSMLYISLVARDELRVHGVDSMGGIDFDYTPDVGVLASDEVSISDSTFEFWNTGFVLEGDALVKIDRSMIGWNGTGVDMTAGDLGVTDSVIQRNEPSGGIAIDAGEAHLSRTTLMGNVSAEGGALHLSDGSAELTNSTVSGNSATGSGPESGYGGGIAAESGSVELAATTVTGNSAAAGGGLHVGANATATVASSIIAANDAEADCSWNGPVDSRGGNLFGPVGCPPGTGDTVSEDPLLAPLRWNGGATPTHGLLPGSPAIDNGVELGLATDQRGVGRSDGEPDSGAFERR